MPLIHYAKASNHHHPQIFCLEHENQNMAFSSPHSLLGRRVIRNTNCSPLSTLRSSVFFKNIRGTDESRHLPPCDTENKQRFVLSHTPG